MSKRNLPLLLVAYSARSLLSSLCGGGLSVEAVDFFADADALEMAPVHQVANWAQVPAFAGSLQPQTILIGGGYETQPAAVAALREISPLLNCSAESCEACRDPALWPLIVRRSGFQCPSVIVPGLDAVAKAQPGDWLIKNRWTAGGVGVRDSEIAWQRGELEGHLIRGEFLQQRLDGTPCSALFWLGTDRCCCLGFFRQLSGELEFGAKPYAYSGAIGPLSPDPQRRGWLKRLAGCLANEFGLSGIVGVDMIENGNSLAVIEINPRITATAELWERANPGVSLIDCLIKGTLAGWSEPLPMAQTPAPLQGKAVLYWNGLAPLSVGATEFEILRQWHRQGQAADLPCLNSSVPPGAPLVTLFATEFSELKVLTKLRRLAVELRQALTTAAVL